MNPTETYELFPRIEIITFNNLFREEIWKTFQDLGLQDAKEYFPQELLTAFDVTVCLVTVYNVIPFSVRNFVGKKERFYFGVYMNGLRSMAILPMEFF